MRRHFRVCCRTMIRAALILEELKKLGVSHVVGLPDNWSAGLISILPRDSGIQYVCVSREAEAFAIASGIWVGGKVPVVLIQNTGLLESGDSFRGTALRMRVPLLCLITYRGYGKVGAAQAGPWDAETLSRADIDSVALITEPTLDAWGLPHLFMNDEADLPRLTDAQQMAQSQMRPVAILITTSLE
jgi:sulfopyruvate decarboxylase subunit alpha